MRCVPHSSSWRPWPLVPTGCAAGFRVGATTTARASAGTSGRSGGGPGSTTYYLPRHHPGTASGAAGLNQHACRLEQGNERGRGRHCWRPRPVRVPVAATSRPGLRKAHGTARRTTSCRWCSSPVRCGWSRAAPVQVARLGLRHAVEELVFDPVAGVPLGRQFLPQGQELCARQGPLAAGSTARAARWPVRSSSRAARLTSSHRAVARSGSVRAISCRSNQVT